ncbi:substrate-binding domain-containing protein [Novosphingobium sp. PS1R-30]|uniref:Substrate-binding domain-containing protein n=1 Tax=Novosphingobium anseongense TaxID=3133436 RepID=A0ABU8RSZ0_9SPHN|nr:MAG: LacI family transcriptional regulator [Novosphingobium sp.]
MAEQTNDKSEPVAGPHRRVTLEDIARICEVSKITVSRALRKSPKVRPAVREKIEAAAREAGYRINLAARDLRLSHRRRVAIVMDWTPNDARPMSDPYPLVLLGGAVEALATAGYAAVVTTSDPALGAEVSDTSGLILLGQGADQHTVKEYSELGLPLVVWGEADGSGSPGPVVVGSDNRLGGAQAATYLLSRGRDRCAFLGDLRHAEMRARRDGCAAALGEQGQGLIDVDSDLTAAAAEAEVERLLAEDGGIDAIFAGSDLMAAGAKRAAARAGRDVAIVGYDDSPTAVAFGITSVSQDWFGGGRLLAQTLLELIAGQSPHPPSLPTRLVTRDT